MECKPVQATTHAHLEPPAVDGPVEAGVALRVEIPRHDDGLEPRPVHDGPGAPVHPPAHDVRVRRHGQQGVELGGEAVLALHPPGVGRAQELPRRDARVVAVAVVHEDPLRRLPRRRHRRALLTSVAGPWLLFLLHRCH